MKSKLLMAGLVAVMTAWPASSPLNADPVQCWYCVDPNPDPEVTGDQWCELRPYTGQPGWTSCTAPWGECIKQGLCPYTVAGPSGIDAAGAQVDGCRYLVPFELGLR